MSRRLQLTAQVIAAIQERRRGGASYAALAKEFGLSQGSIANALKAQAPKPKRSKPRRKPTKKKAAKSPPAQATQLEGASASTPPPAADDLVSLLSRQVATLERIARSMIEVDEDGDEQINVAGFASLQRVLNASVNLLNKITPPPPVDHDESPDMLAAAERAREQLHKLLARALERAA